jgi:hypothetical protein
MTTYWRRYMMNFVTLYDGDQTYTKYRVYKKGAEYYVAWDHAIGTDLLKIDNEFNLLLKDHRGKITKVGNGAVFFIQSALKLLAEYDKDLFEDSEIFKLEEV